ncbi:MAG: hypothetical protein WDZ36_03230, partial [Balneolaceae bacterium]
MARKKPSELKQDFVSRLSTQKQHVLALGILLLLPVILFHTTILGDQQFMGQDTIQWRASAESIFEHRAQHDGEEPLWSTNLFGGMPAYVVHVSKSVPHLDNMVLGQLRSIWPAVPYWVLLGGTYFFFILQGFRPLTSALGSIFISFTTYIPIIIGAGHNIKFIAYSFIPWMLAGYWLLTRSDKRGWGFFLFAIAATLEFRAGHPQVTYYFVYLFAGLFFYDTWRFYKNERLFEWVKISGLITAAVLLGFLGSAEQYLRLIEYSPYSIRGGSMIADAATGGGLDLEYAFRWSQGILESLTLVIPNLFGGDSGLAYWGEKPGTSGPHYMGAIALLLFFIALFRNRKPIVYVFLGTGLLTLSFSWGYHFPLNELWFNILPGFDKFRTPEMWLIVTVFCFSVIAMYGLQACFHLLREGKQGIKKLYLPIGTALGTGLLILLLANTFLTFESSREREYVARQIATQNDLSPDNQQVQQRTSQIIESRFKPERRELARNDTLRYLLIAGVASVLILMFIQTKISAGFLWLSLILLASFDMLTVGNRYIGEESQVPARLELTDVIEQQERPVDQYIRNHINDPEGYPYRVFPLDSNPFNNAIPSYFYPTIGGYSGAKLSLIQDVIDQGLFAGPQGLNTAVLDMLNVKFITARRNIPLPGFTEVYSENEDRVFENENVLPKAWFVEQIRMAGSPREAFRQILPESGFDPRQTAIVESDQPLHPVESTDPASEVHVETYQARKIVLTLERNEPGFLVLGEIYYPEGWTAILNGEEIPIHKTNYLLRGFEIPAGEHTLSMKLE